MQRLLILILAVFAFAASNPASATQAMCAHAMPSMARMDHGMSMDHGKKGSCCNERHKACLQDCDATCVVALTTPAHSPASPAISTGLIPQAPVVSLTVAKPSRGLDPPPRTFA
jgi:hypothetical protein